MFWLYLILALLITLPAMITGVSGIQGGWEIRGATQIATPIVWAFASAASVAWTRGMQPGAWKVFTFTFLAALALIGAAFGEALGLFSGIAFNYGATETQLAIAFVQFFALGVAVASVPSAVIGGIAVFLTRAFAPPTSAHTQEI
jgi:hypothetical protein